MSIPSDRVLGTPPTNTPATTREEPAESAGELYYQTPTTPEEAFQAIGRLRKDARDEIDRLIGFLDKTDDYVSRELEVEDGNEEPGGDDEPSLGSFDGMTDQSKSWVGSSDPWTVDREKDNCDDEPSLGSSGHGSGGPIFYTIPVLSADGQLIHDCEGDEHDGREPQDDDEPDDTGIGDLDGLKEQVGSEFCVFWEFV